MNAEDKYLLGMLWKFGTIKPGTNQFVFQSYDKFEQMEYIRSRLAPSKAIKVSTRKDPRSGKEKTLYRLNFTNEEWADLVRNYSGVKAQKIADKDFIRGFFETKGNVNNNKDRQKRLVISADNDEINIVKKIITLECKAEGSISHGNTCTRISYGINDVMKIKSVMSNDSFWDEIIKKMNPEK